MDNSKSNKQDWGYPSEMTSLFEYYGKPQGVEISTKVYKLSVADRVTSEHKDVTTSKYKGTVRVYPKTWLDKLDFIDNTIGGNDKGDGLTNYKSDLEIVNELISEYEQKAEE
tara:strand:- start:189 stop:524 length:336 start_codon:yes stop_codon:yes gene_type:complete